MMNCRQILVCSIFLLVGVLWSLLLAIKGQMTSLTYSDLNSEEIQQSQIDSDEWPISSFSLETPLANQFPTLAEALEMVRLSAIVYTFRAKKDDSFCATYNVNHTRCHYYHHDRSLGTQVWIASNSKKRYLAVVFAGTDDLRTSLEDIDIAKKPFGNNGTVQLPKDLYSKVKIHAGFDNAVFTGAFDEVHTRLKRLQKEYPLYGRLYTTGHSLGAANSILMATGLAWLGERVVSINFGCPRVGNMAWRDFLGVGSSLDSRLAIWRVVLGWDLVPRLPDFFEHVGHTIQLWSEDHHKYDKRSPNVVECYYKHCESLPSISRCCSPWCCLYLTGKDSANF